MNNGSRDPFYLQTSCSLCGHSEDVTAITRDVIAGSTVADRTGVTCKLVSSGPARF